MFAIRSEGAQHFKLQVLIRVRAALRVGRVQEVDFGVAADDAFDDGFPAEAAVRRELRPVRSRQGRFAVPLEVTVPPRARPTLGGREATTIPNQGLRDLIFFCEI